MNYYYGNQGGGNNNQQPPYGYQSSPNGYRPPNGYNPFNADYVEKAKEKKDISRISIAVGLAVLGFSVLSSIISMFLWQMPWFQNNYQSNSIFTVCFDALYSIIIIGIPFLLAYLFVKKRGQIKQMPLGTPYNGKAFVLLIFAGLMACIVGSYVTSVFSNIIEAFFGITFSMPDDGIKLTSPAIIIAYILRTAVIPAFIEEFSVRGVVMQPLRKYGDGFAIIMSSMVFALMHRNMVQIPFAFIAGIAIGYAVIATGTMWTGVIIHFLNNFTSIMMQVLFDNMSAVTANLIILLITGGIVVVGVICAIIYKKYFSHGFKIKQQKNPLLSRSEKNTAFIVTIPMIIAIISLLIETVRYIEF